MKRIASNRIKCVLFLFTFIVIGVIHTVQVKAVDNIRQTDVDKTQAVISWDAKTYEDSFEIILVDHFYYWEGGHRCRQETVRSLGSIYSHEYVITGLTAGEVYRAWVYSYDSDGNFMEQREVSIETLPGTAQYYAGSDQSGVSLKWSSYFQQTTTWGDHKSTKVTMTFDLYVDIVEQDTADGYQIVLYNDKGKKIKTANMTAEPNAIYQRKAFYTVKESLYSVKARAYKMVGGHKVYGDWSERQYAIRQPVAMSQFSGGKLYVKWEKVPKATGYEVWACRSVPGEKNEYSRIAKTSKSKNMISVKKLNKKKFQKGAVYKYYVVALKKAGSKTYRSAFNYANKVSYK